MHPPPLDPATRAAIATEHAHLAHNYQPLPVVLASGQGAWVTDIEGRRYLDFLAAYLGSIHPGMTDFFAGQGSKTGLDPDENARNVADGLARTLRAI